MFRKGNVNIFGQHRWRVYLYKSETTTRGIIANLTVAKYANKIGCPIIQHTPHLFSAYLTEILGLGGRQK